jgi:hypothetical protein
MVGDNSFDYNDIRDNDEWPFGDFDYDRDLPDRSRPTEYNERPEPKSWYVQEGVDYFDEPLVLTSRTPESANMNQDPFDDDMSRIRPTSNSIEFFLYLYTYRNSEWFSWS